MPVSVSKLSWFLQASVVFLLSFSCAPFRPVYQHEPNDTITIPKINIREDSRIKLVLRDDLLKVNMTAGLKCKKYNDKKGNSLQKIMGRYYYVKLDSTYIYLYTVGRTHYGDSYKNHFEMPIDQVVFLEKRKFSFGKTIGIVGIAIVGFSVYAVSTISITY